MSISRHEYNPQLIHESAFIGQGAVIVGEVHIAEACGIWFNATIRGDNDSIHVGRYSNIQEGATIHADPNFPVVIGNRVTIGHRAIVHGATIHDNVMIGMGSIILNGAIIGADSIVGAGALVTQGKEFPPGQLILGSPAKTVRELTDKEIERNRFVAEKYVENAALFREEN